MRGGEGGPRRAPRKGKTGGAKLGAHCTPAYLTFERIPYISTDRHPSFRAGDRQHPQEPARAEEMAETVPGDSHCTDGIALLLLTPFLYPSTTFQSFT